MLVTIVEEVRQDQRLLYLERNDLRFAVEASVPSEGRALALERVTKGLGYSVVSAGFGGRDSLHVIVRPPVASRPFNAREPVFAPADGAAAVRTASGRRR